jgi:hypothetical protein
MLTNGERGVKAPSRVKGRGQIVRALRRLVHRVAVFAEHRASTDAERRWSCALFDRLESALREACADPVVRAELSAADRRSAVSRKTRDVRGGQLNIFPRASGNRQPVARVLCPKKNFLGRTNNAQVQKLFEVGAAAAGRRPRPAAGHLFARVPASLDALRQESGPLATVS